LAADTHGYQVADGDRAVARRRGDMTHHVEESHAHEPMSDPEGSNGLVGYAAIKYAAIVVIVLAILAFLAWYVLPRLG
jgi:hypothetical protein